MKETDFFSLFHSVVAEMTENINKARKIVSELQHSEEEISSDIEDYSRRKQENLRKISKIKFVRTWMFGIPLVRLLLQLEQFIGDADLPFREWKKLKDEKSIPQTIRIVGKWLTPQQRRDVGKTVELCCLRCLSLLTDGVCISCAIKRDELDGGITFKDLGRTNTSEKFKYTQLVHFKDAIKRYQGKQTIVIPDVVMELIKEEMNLKKLTKTTLSKSHIFNTLETVKYIGKLKLADFYGHINLIHYKITGIPCPDITHLEGKLLERFESFEESYISMIKSRKHSINVDYKLGRILQLTGVPVSRRDFHCLRTRDKQDEHDVVWKHICKKNTWPILQFV